MVIDDDPDGSALGLCVESYRLNPTFEVSGYQTAEEAEKALVSGLLPDYCQTDFGLKHPSGDQFHLLRRFAGTVPFVGFTGRSRVTTDTAEFMLLGGRFVLEKGDVGIDTLQQTAFRWGLTRLLLAGHWLDKFLLQSMDVLFEQQPGDVNAWSLGMPRAGTPELGYDPSYLRRNWSGIGLPPRDALFLFHLYHTYCQCGSSAASRSDPGLRARLDSLLTTYHSRRSAMLARSIHELGQHIDRQLSFSL